MMIKNQPVWSMDIPIMISIIWSSYYYYWVLVFLWLNWVDQLTQKVTSLWSMNSAKAHGVLRSLLPQHHPRDSTPGSHWVIIHWGDFPMIFHDVKLGGLQFFWGMWCAVFCRWLIKTCLQLFAMVQRQSEVSHWWSPSMIACYSLSSPYLKTPTKKYIVCMYILYSLYQVCVCTWCTYCISYPYYTIIPYYTVWYQIIPYYTIIYYGILLQNYIRIFLYYQTMYHTRINPQSVRTRWSPANWIHNWYILHFRISPHANSLQFRLRVVPDAGLPPEPQVCTWWASAALRSGCSAHLVMSRLKSMDLMPDHHSLVGVAYRSHLCLVKIWLQHKRAPNWSHLSVLGHPSSNVCGFWW